MDKQTAKGNRFFQDLQRLRKITSSCRDDMHEPDEQGVNITLQGTVFDNAGVEGEMKVGIFHQDASDKIEWFNLATLVALARLAAFGDRKEIEAAPYLLGALELATRDIGPARDNATCHTGICSKEKCSRCQRAAKIQKALKMAGSKTIL